MGEYNEMNVDVFLDEWQPSSSSPRAAEKEEAEALPNLYKEDHELFKAIMKYRSGEAFPNADEEKMKEIGYVWIQKRGWVKNPRSGRGRKKGRKRKTRHRRKRRHRRKTKRRRRRRRTRRRRH